MWEEKQLSNMGGGVGGGQKKLLTDVVGGGTTPRDWWYFCPYPDSFLTKQPKSQGEGLGLNGQTRSYTDLSQPRTEQSGCLQSNLEQRALKTVLKLEHLQNWFLLVLLRLRNSNRGQSNCLRPQIIKPVRIHRWSSKLGCLVSLQCGLSRALQ